MVIEHRLPSGLSVMRKSVVSRCTALNASARSSGQSSMPN
jgi:hypothetical protein